MLLLVLALPGEPVEVIVLPVTTPCVRKESPEHDWLSRFVFLGEVCTAASAVSSPMKNASAPLGSSSFALFMSAAMKSCKSLWRQVSGCAIQLRAFD